MLEVIDSQVNDVLSIVATDTVTHEDYLTTLIPTAEALMKKGPIKVLYVIGGACTGFEFEALVDDSRFGFKNRHEVSHIALVTDHMWIRTMVNMFKPFFHGEIRLFCVADLVQAKDWIVKTKRKEA